MKFIINTGDLNLMDLMDDIMEVIMLRAETKEEVYPLLALYSILSKGKTPPSFPKGTVTITVRRGCVEEVSELPPGWECIINDLDSQEENVPASEDEEKLCGCEQYPVLKGGDLCANCKDILDAHNIVTTEAPSEVVDIDDLKDWKKCGLCGECRWRNTCIGPVTSARRCPGNVSIDLIPADSRDGDLDQFEHGDPQ